MAGFVRDVWNDHTLYGKTTPLGWFELPKNYVLSFEKRAQVMAKYTDVSKQSVSVTTQTTKVKTSATTASQTATKTNTAASLITTGSSV